MDAADMLLWLGSPNDAPAHPLLCRLAAQSDRRAPPAGADIAVSALTGEGMDRLHRWIVDHARGVLPVAGEVALNQRQREALSLAETALRDDTTDDPLLIAEQLRGARIALDAVVGGAATEDMLDALFGRFCIGK